MWGVQPELFLLEVRLKAESRFPRSFRHRLETQMTKNNKSIFDILLKISHQEMGQMDY